MRDACRASADASRVLTAQTQVPYEIRESPIAGRGIFATEPIACGTCVWRYAVGESVMEHDEKSLRERLSGLSSSEARDLLEHVYTWEGRVIEILDDAKVWNHAPDHNTGNHPNEGSGQGDGMSSYARRDIAAGEELTDDYATFDEIPWFEELCLEHNADSCVAVGKAHRAAPDPMRLRGGMSDVVEAEESTGLPKWLDELLKPGVSSGVFLTLKLCLVGLVLVLALMLCVLTDSTVRLHVSIFLGMSVMLLFLVIWFVGELQKAMADEKAATEDDKKKD